MDLFTSKCNRGHNRILKKRETCPDCVARDRERVRESRRCEPQRDRERLPPIAEWIPVGFHPDSCDHVRFYDAYTARCNGCGLTAAQLVSRGVARYRINREGYIHA